MADNSSILVLCSVSKEIIRRLKNEINNIINMYFDCSILLHSWEIITGYSNNNKIIRIFVNFILHIFKWEIWKIRNLIKHENKSFTSDQVFDTIVRKIANAARFIDLTKAEPNTLNSHVIDITSVRFLIIHTSVLLPFH